LIVSEATPFELQKRLQNGDLLLRIGPFIARIQSDIKDLAGGIALLYKDFELCPAHEFSDFHVQVLRASGFRKWIKPLVRFYFDGQPSFVPLPASQAFAMLEWGLNWCVASNCHQYLVIHAALIERHGRVALLPAPPGSGKSTLCAGLVLSGWRLLSDELALYELKTGNLTGMARPINLKNNSIPVIQAFAPDVVMTAPMRATTKGTVALVRPPTGSVARMHEPVRVDWVILPKYVAGAEAKLSQYEKSRTFMLMAEQSFNYDLLGVTAFKALAHLVTQSECYEFEYSRLADAVQVFDSLSRKQPF
jgi:HprK-related kinase A